jgi:hypothetical protein
VTRRRIVSASPGKRARTVATAERGDVADMPESAQMTGLRDGRACWQPDTVRYGSRVRSPPGQGFRLAASTSPARPRAPHRKAWGGRSRLSCARRSNPVSTEIAWSVAGGVIVLSTNWSTDRDMPGVSD